MKLTPTRFPTSPQALAALRAIFATSGAEVMKPKALLQRLPSGVRRRLWHALWPGGGPWNRWRWVRDIRGSLGDEPKPLTGRTGPKPGY